MDYKSFADAVRQAGKVSYTTALRRFKNGMSAEKAVSLEPYYRNNDLVGTRFGRLKVVSRDDFHIKSKALRWNCVCVCGVEVSVFYKNLKHGKTRSCGCLRKEVAAQKRKPLKINGVSDESEASST